MKTRSKSFSKSRNRVASNPQSAGTRPLSLPFGYLRYLTWAISILILPTLLHCRPTLTTQPISPWTLCQSQPDQRQSQSVSGGHRQAGRQVQANTVRHTQKHTIANIRACLDPIQGVEHAKSGSNTAGTPRTKFSTLLFAFEDENYLFQHLPTPNASPHTHAFTTAALHPRAQPPLAFGQYFQ